MQSIEAIVAQVMDLSNGEQRQVSVGETDVLLIRLQETFYAVGAYCTHYQAPLAEGVLHCDRNQAHIVCPWHGACFDVTGEQQQPPGLDSLTSYPVRVEGENVIVCVPADQDGSEPEAKGARTPSMVAFDPEQDQRTFAIVGGGAAGAHAAETLRVAGYQGRIILISQDDRLPYDRTWLSKDYLTGKASAQQMPLRSAAFYAKHGIEVWLNRRVTEVEPQSKTIAFQIDEPLQYDALLLATGGQPRQLQVPGTTLPQVFTLRSFADTDRILAAAAQVTQAVVVGSSFISMEVAAGLAQRDVNVTVVSPTSVPFEKILGKEIGQLFQQVHEEHGVTIRSNCKVARLEGQDSVEAVVLDNDDRLPADLVVVGVGVQPATEFIKHIELAEDQSIIVDQYLQAAAGLYAAGDIARYPDDAGELMRVEHWRIAAQQGRIAAYNMAGKPTVFRAVPVFWTMQFDFPLRYVGHAEQWDDLIIQGDLQQRQFIALYVKADRIVAAAASQRDTEMAAILALMQMGQMPAPEQIRSPSIDWIDYLDRHPDAA